MMKMQPSLNNELPASKIWHTTREQGAGTETESSWSSLPLTALPLTRALPCHSKLRGSSQSKAILSGHGRARSLFGDLVYVRNSKETFELFTY